MREGGLTRRKRKAQATSPASLRKLCHPTSNFQVTHWYQQKLHGKTSLSHRVSPKFQNITLAWCCYFLCSASSMAWAFVFLLVRLPIGHLTGSWGARTREGGNPNPNPVPRGNGYILLAETIYQCIVDIYASIIQYVASLIVIMIDHINRWCQYLLNCV